MRGHCAKIKTMRARHAGRRKQHQTDASCRLCGAPGVLEYSHILPEFIYKPLYDADHEFVEVASEGGYIKSILAKGIREHLLCRACEKRFSKYEDHAARVHREMRRRLDGAAVGDLVTVPANYEQLKLFQLSILWRAAVSKDPMFHAAQAEAIEPKLREMLLAEIPGTIYTFPCIGLAPAGRPSFVTTIAPGGLGAIRDEPAIWFTFLGVHWLFMLNESLPPHEWLPHISATHLGFCVAVIDQTGDSAVERLAYGNKGPALESD
jgi:hypothetical protein